VKPVMQTIRGRGPKFGEPPGNCLQASLASILELPLDQVPHFCAIDPADDYAWSTAMNAWLEDRFGLRVIYLQPKGWTPEGYHLLDGESPRGSMHSTVGYRGALVHDPHPEGGGVTDPRFGIFVTVNPARHSRGIMARPFPPLAFQPDAFATVMAPLGSSKLTRKYDEDCSVFVDTLARSCPYAPQLPKGGDTSTCPNCGFDALWCAHAGRQCDAIAQ
jgi:hypothetical protein